MQTATQICDTKTAPKFEVDTERYARCIKASKRIRWDIDEDVIRGRDFDFSQKFLPDGLSKAHELEFLSEPEARLLSQIQGRSYANIFGLVERAINAKILELSRDHLFGDQIALEALVRFSDEEIKHQKLFRRIEVMIAGKMPSGYKLIADPNLMAVDVLGKSTWAVLAVTCLIELFTQAHYRESIEPDSTLSELYKDVFLYHWKEESQHAILDELEWRREDAKLNAAQVDAAVDDLIELVAAIDGMISAQSCADTEYFLSINSRELREVEQRRLYEGVQRAYRWQYIGSGVALPRFQEILSELVTGQQMERISSALTPILSQ